IKSNIPDYDKYDLLISFDEVLGFGLKNVARITYHVSREVQDLIDERYRLRKERKFDEADKVRKTIEEKGYTLIDDKKGSSVKLIS
ncbi:MAG: Cysteine-tRNA ligase, partial [Candidatus Woesebacteria bacterium GW2011_GWD1_38_10]